MFIFPTVAENELINPVNDPEVYDHLATFDEHVVAQNGDKIELELQLLLMPMWSLRSKILDLSKPLQTVVFRYMAVRDKMLKIDHRISKKMAKRSDFLFICQEILILSKAYNTYKNKVQLFRSVLFRHIIAFSTADVAIWEDLDNLSIANVNACKIRAYCIKTLMTEYTLIEENIDTSLESCLDILSSAMTYWKCVRNTMPDNLVMSDEGREEVEECFQNLN